MSPATKASWRTDRTRESSSRMAALRPRMPHDAMIGPRISRGRNFRMRSLAAASSYGKKCSRKSFSERMRPSAVLLSFSSAKQNLVTGAFRSLVGVCWSSTLSPLGSGGTSLNPSAAPDPAEHRGSHVREPPRHFANFRLAFEELADRIPEPREERFARAGLDREGKGKIVACGNERLNEVDRDGRVGAGLDARGERFEVAAGERDAGHSQGHRIPEENLGEALGDNRA